MAEQEGLAWFPHWFPIDERGVMPQFIPTARDRWSYGMMADFADRQVLEERVVAGWRGHWTHQSGKLAFECPEPNCYFKIGLRSPDQSTEHKCPMLGDTRVSWSVAKTLLEIVWGQFDDAIDYIKSHKYEANPEEYANYQGQARAYSRMLAVFMTPLFVDDEKETAEQKIAREGIKRWKHRQEGTEYETPGLGSRKYEGPPASQAGLDTSTHRAGRPSRVAHKLTPGEVAQLKKGAESGMFTNADLATVYKISEATVAAILAD